MPEAKDPLDSQTAQQPPAGAVPQAIRLPVRLTPVNNSDQPVYANHAALTLVQGVAYVDCGFIEPSALGLVARAAQSGKPLPKALQGKLAVRVALSMEALQQLHLQLTQAVRGLRQKRPPTAP